MPYLKLSTVTNQYRNPRPGIGVGQAGREDAQDDRQLESIHRRVQKQVHVSY